MRTATVFQRLLDLQGVRVTDVDIVVGALTIIVDVMLRGAGMTCSRCGRRCRAVYDSKVRTWRHLDFGPWAVHLRFRQRRVDCPRCKAVVTESPSINQPSASRVPEAPSGQPTASRRRRSPLGAERARGREASSRQPRAAISTSPTSAALAPAIAAPASPSAGSPSAPGIRSTVSPALTTAYPIAAASGARVPAAPSSQAQAAKKPSSMVRNGARHER